MKSGENRTARCGQKIGAEAESICQAALDHQARLIVVGVRGETTTVTCLLGNLCEPFRRMEKQIPVMIAKHARERRSFRLSPQGCVSKTPPRYRPFSLAASPVPTPERGNEENRRHESASPFLRRSIGSE